MNARGKVMTTMPAFSARALALTLALAGLLLALAVPAAHAAFGLQSFTADVFKSDGTSIENQAGGHPFTGVTSFRLNTTGAGPLESPDGDVKNVRVDLPAGLISNPEATPKCSQAAFAAGTCSKDSIIGREDVVASVAGLIASLNAPIFNLEPPAGKVSDFAFGGASAGAFPNTQIPITHIIGGVRDTGDYGLFFTISDIPNSPARLISSALTFWGVPADPAHDAYRGGASGSPAVPFLSNPTLCAGRLTTTIRAESYNGEVATASALTDTGALNCGAVPFAPSIAVSPSSTQNDSPTALDVDLHVPQSSSKTVLATSHVKDVAVTLPPGLTINPGAANGLAACTDAQLGAGTTAAVTCPAGSQIGTAMIKTPVLAGPMTGGVYLGQPLAGNPYRIFLAVSGFGINVRLKGSVAADPVTGQLTATFADNPQVPFADFILHFNGGPAATLATPLDCGSATTTTALAPYAANGTKSPASAFTVDADGKGTACPPAPFSLGFTAGTSKTQAGGFSPFTLTVARADANRYLGRISAQLPPGLLGVIPNVGQCAEAAAAAGSCPDASRIGTTTVAAGAGSAPFSVTGPVYLTGPYNGAPFGLAIVIHAVAGPFDLGTVVVRAAIRVDGHDAHLTVDSDALPSILQGIPLRLRTVTVAVDRDKFIFNPTSCEALTTGGTLTATDGTAQAVSAPFQATGCDALDFSPTLEAQTSAKASKTTGAALKVTVKNQLGKANIKSVSVELPKALTANTTTLRNACLEATFKADPATCPAGSNVGTAKAVTPILDSSLSGPVYLVAHGATLPTIEALLRAPNGINVNLTGSIKFVNGTRIQSTFGAVPDVPITSFALDLPQGAHPALSASGDLCATPQIMPTTIIGQNGKQITQQTKIKVDDCGGVAGFKAGSKLRVISRKVKGHLARIKVSVPKAGTLKISGKGLKTVKRKVRKGGIYTFTVKLSAKGVSAARAKHRRHKRLTIKARVGLSVKKGVKRPSPASVRTTLTFRG